MIQIRFRSLLHLYTPLSHITSLFQSRKTLHAYDNPVSTIDDNTRYPENNNGGFPTMWKEADATSEGNHPY
jgi:hypothetical protein